MITFFSDERAIYGELKASANGDFDALYSAKNTAENHYKIINIMSFLPLIPGIGLCFTIIGIPIALLFLGLVWFLRSKNASFKKNLAHAYKRYEQELVTQEEQSPSKNQTNENN